MYCLCCLYTDLLSQLGGQNKMKICSVAVFKRGMGTASSSALLVSTESKG